MTRPPLAETVRLAVAAVIPPLAGWAFWAFVLRLGPNDFHDYWLAARLLLEGRSPYDAGAMAELAAREHLSFTLGGGYSYPLPFALAMVPFGALPFDVAVAAFEALSLALFGVTVALGAGWVCGWEQPRARRRLTLAFAAGLYPPVYGTVAMGQANLILFPLLAAGGILALSPGRSGLVRRATGGLLLGLAGAVKLVPAATAVPLALGRRWGAAAAVAVGALGAVAVATLVVPWAAAGSGSLAALFDPDGYYTNQSINGFATRFLADTSRTVAIWRGPDPGLAMVALTAAFSMATLAVMWRGRPALASRRGAAAGLGLALVAATAGAPKTSFWNESVVLVALGVLLAVDWPGDGPWRRLDRGLLAVWFGSAVVWAAVWAAEPHASGPLAPIVTLLWSSSLLGLLALWWLFARRLGTGERPDQAAASSTIS